MKSIRFVEIFCVVMLTFVVATSDVLAQGKGRGHGGNGDRGKGKEIRGDRGQNVAKQRPQKVFQQERQQAPQRAYQAKQQRAGRNDRDISDRWARGNDQRREQISRRDNDNAGKLSWQRAEQARRVQSDRWGRIRNASNRGSDSWFRQPAFIRDQDKSRERSKSRNEREARNETRGRLERKNDRRTDPWFRQPSFIRDQDRNRGKRDNRNERTARIEQRGRDQRQATRGSDPWFRQRDLMRDQVRRSENNDRPDRIFSRNGKDAREIYRDSDNRGDYAYVREDRRSGRDRDSSYYDRRDNWRTRSVRRTNAWFYDPYDVSYKNYGQYRSAQVHQRNAARKWARNYDSFWGRDYYDYDRDDDYWRRRSIWRNNVVRNIIVDPWYYAGYDRYYYPVRRFPRHDGFRLYISYSNYAPYSYSYPRYDPYYDGYVSYDPYYRYQQYPDNGYASYNDPYYDPYYAPANYDDSYYDPYYDPYRRTSPYRAIGSVIGSLPIAQILYQITGNGVASEIVGGFLSQAYYQGYQAGRYARRQGYRDVYYDPYDRGYDGYSANLAENRRIFSEGYSLGYQDAMERRSGYEPYLDRSPDLVSMFVGLSL